MLKFATAGRREKKVQRGTMVVWAMSETCWMCGVGWILCISTSTEAVVCAGEVVCKKHVVFSVGGGESGQDTLCVSVAVLLK